MASCWSMKKKKNKNRHRTGSSTELKKEPPCLLARLWSPIGEDEEKRGECMRGEAKGKFWFKGASETSKDGGP